MSDDQAMSLPPLLWSQQNQDAATAHKPSAERRRRTQSDQVPPKANQRSKVPVKQLSLRIDDSTHAKISQAAQKADKSINAWMEEVLDTAADDVLGLGGSDGAIQSAAIRDLLEDPRYSKQLIEEIAPHLRDNSFSVIFQFSNPLRKLLVGWDRIKPLLAQVDLPSVDLSQLTAMLGIAKLTDAILPYLPTADAITAIQFSTALKQFLLGIIAVKPFMKEGNQSLLAVVMIIESLVQEIEIGR